MTDDPTYTTRALGPDTWDDFAALVGANNGVWGGCWCMGFHPEGLDRDASANRDAKRAHVEGGTVRQVLVYAGDGCVGWCQYGTPTELPNIQNRKAYARGLGGLPDRLRLHRQEAPGPEGRSRGRRRRAGGDKGGRRGRRRGLPGAGRRAAAAARVLPAHRPRDPFRGARLRQGPADRQVALGDAPDRGRLTTTRSGWDHGATGPKFREPPTPEVPGTLIPRTCMDR
jgi:hypothetical protein